MSESDGTTFTAFEGMTRLASGPLATVTSAVLEAERRGRIAPILVFNDDTGVQTDLDFRPVAPNAARQAAAGAGAAPLMNAASGAESPQNNESAPEARRAGRPRLGVVGREVTLLPRHWEWLAAQPGGASVALRKLIDAARKINDISGLRRKHQESVYNFISVLAGNLPGFEEANRALFAGNRDSFELLMASWPGDVRDYALQLLRPVAMPLEGA
jgi:hypothetical protein